jgi:hypothetical protein
MEIVLNTNIRKQIQITNIMKENQMLYQNQIKAVTQGCFYLQYIAVSHIDSLSWYLLFVFVYVYWCSTRFPYQMMFASFNCNCVTSWAGTTNPSGAPEYTPVFSAVRVAQSLAFYAVFCISLFVLLSFFFWSLYCQSFLDLRLLIISFF